ncbi:MAG: hypothetical protein UH071_06640 [Paludibacteraceae bacterium]|nr:hypothetical protein [Paludibacteraceae bacterium]
MLAVLFAVLLTPFIAGIGFLIGVDPMIYIFGTLAILALVIELLLISSSGCFLFLLSLVGVAGIILATFHFLPTGDFYKTLLLGVTISGCIGLFISFFNMKISCGGV